MRLSHQAGSCQHAVTTVTQQMREGMVLIAYTS